MSNISERIFELIQQHGYSYAELSAMTGIPKSALQRYATGKTEKIPLERVSKLAKALGNDPAYLMGWEDEPAIPPGFEPVHMVRKPLLGSIACGEPILAQENIEDLLDVPADIPCDFLLRCKGDSMIGARIQDGDIVYIRQQGDVENGQIAAVLIGDTATLKRVYKAPGQLILQAENPAYPPMVHTAAGAETVRIIGLAVGFLSKVK